MYAFLYCLGIGSGSIAHGEPSASNIPAQNQQTFPLLSVPRSDVSSNMQASLQSLLDTLLYLEQQGGISQKNSPQFLQAYSSFQVSSLMLQARLEQMQNQLASIGVSSDLESRRRLEAARINILTGFINSELGVVAQAIQSGSNPEQLFADEGFVYSANVHLSMALYLLRQNITTQKARILRASNLPYRQSQLLNRSPELTPAITPAYMDTSVVDANAEDLQAGPGVVLSEEILAKARELDNDYIQIYDFVRSQVKTEWYAGSMKGAEATLRQLGGNDVDQASLLIALFRASGLSSRYVHGVIELPIEDVMQSLALVDENQAIRALDSAGVAYTPQIRGGRVAAVHIEQTWVEAFVPYNNYRGSMIDGSGESWLPLMPAIKTYSHTPATRILQTMGMDNQAEINQFLSQPQATDFLSQLRNKVNDYLAVNGQANSYEQQLGTHQVQVSDLGLIPHTLPAKVIAVTGEYASLPGLMRHHVRFVVRNADKDTATIVLDYRVPVSEVASERLTLSYIPATVDDQRTVNEFGGLDNVPAYLVNLRPQIKINGRQKAVASDAIDMGISHRFEIYLEGPGYSERLNQSVIAGGYHAIAINAQKQVAPVIKDDPADTEYPGARILNEFGQTYTRQWQEAEEELSGLHDVSIIRPLPSVAIVSNVYKVDMVLGEPHQIEFQGVSMDAALRLAQPVSRSADRATEKAWMQMAALQGSNLESKIFEQTMQVESISTDKGMQLATEQGIVIHTLTSANSASVLPTLNHPAEVISEIDNWLRLGMQVQVPQTTITLNSWQGSVWRVEDPSSGAAGYFIAGGLAGGTTTIYPAGWLNTWYNMALAAANSPPPNTDPLAVASISKIPITDGQSGKVGQPLQKPLAVLLRDAAGLPVAGAQVTFYVAAGGGKVANADSFVATSDAKGIASVDFVTGQKTALNPYYTYENEGDEKLSQAGLNIIDAAVASYRGILRPRSPFSAIAFPQQVVSLARTDGGNGGLNYTPGQWVDAINMVPVDQFNNPVSNANVTFSITNGGNSCNQPVAAIPGAVFDNHFDVNGCPSNPVAGECGAASYTAKSGPFGASAGVIVGNLSLASYTVNVSSGAASPEQYTYTTGGSCSNNPLVSINTTYLAGKGGQNLNASRAGELFDYPITMSLTFGLPSVEKIENGKVFWMSDYNYTRVNATVNFNVSSGGSASAAVNVGTGTYQTKVTTGVIPGINTLTAETSDIIMPQYIQILEDALKTATTQNEIDTATANINSAKDFLAQLRNWDVTEVHAVVPEVTGIDSLGAGEGLDPTAIILNDNDLSAFPANINYIIDPASYFADYSVLNIYQADTRVYAFNGIGTQASGFTPLPRATAFDSTLTYEAEVVLNQGGSAEVKSDRVPLKIAQRLFKNVDRYIDAYLELDLLNERRCEQGSQFNFTLTDDARVTLKFINRVDGKEELFLDNVLLARGEHSYDFSPRNLNPGKYRFELSGAAQSTSIQETVQGSAISQYKTHDRLPVGHTLVKGVNVFNGSLSLSNNDMSVAGRGIPLELTRSYSSKAGAFAGSMGVGWTHNYDSKISITRCGEVVVTGGQGGGMTFVQDANGKLQPLKGYHGTLEPNFTDNSFDFYSKDGTRYHYRLFGGRAAWDLEYIEDTNGNITKLAYDPSSGKHAKLLVVEDPAGRTLKFSWEQKNFIGIDEPRPVIVAVDGPDGMRVEYQYDAHGNMTRAARVEGDSENGYQDLRVDSYTYNIDAALRYDVQHKLLSHTNPNNAVTSYTYNELIIDLERGGSSVARLMPYGFIETVTEPEGGVTTFTFDTPHHATNTEVKDGRNNITSYALNKYGSPLSITDAETNVTSMTWATDDIVMQSRTDANGIKTEYTHDADGNVLTETVTSGLLGLGSYTITNTYKDFPDKPWIKNRLASRTDRNGFTTFYDYDGNGNLVTITDPEGFTVAHGYLANGDRFFSRDTRNFNTFFTYDTYGNLETVTNPLGHKVTTNWNIRSLPEIRTDARNRTTRFAYDALNRLTTKTDPYGNTRTFTYDDVGNKLSEKDEEGRLTVWTYDGENRVKTITNARNDVTRYDYDLVGNKTRETNWRGFSTSYSYDKANRLKTVAEPLGKITSYDIYDGVGNLKQVTDAENHVTSYDYDLLNRRTHVTDARNGVFVTEYDGENKRAEVNPLNQRTEYVYDKNNRLKTVTQPLGRITAYEYDGNGNKTKETDPNGGVRQFVYDSAGRLSKQIDALNYVTTLFYDENNNLTSSVDRRLNEVSHTYDDLNRRITTTDQDGFITVFGYDRVGNNTRQELPNGNVVTNTYDALNRLEKVTDKLGQVALYGYDENGNRTREVDANGNETLHVYDALDRLDHSSLPENRSVSFTYYPMGNRKTETDPRGKTTSYIYDELYRPTTITDPLGYTLVYTYDALGNRKTEKDKRGFITRYDYDDLNRVDIVTDPLSQVINYDYDLVGNKTQEIDKRGIVSKYTYDAENRLLTVTKDNLLISRAEYDEEGNKKFEHDARGNITGYIYNKRNLLKTESGELAAISHFDYDTMGNRNFHQDPEGRISRWTYDVRNRMETETNSASETTTYTYDGNGNRKTLKRPKGNTWTYTYDGADRLTDILDPEQGNTHFSYDENGNRLSQQDARLFTTTYSYDDLNRLKTTTYADNAVESYDYDENGNRTQLTDAKGQVFSYSYDELNRETLRTYPLPLAPTGDDIQSITTAYDANNNPTIITENYSGATGIRTTTKVYDRFDRLVSVTDAFGKTIGYSYDANGNRDSLTDPDGKITRYSFDKLNRLETVTAEGGVTRYDYDRSSLNLRVTYPNGTVSDNSYDNARRTKQVINRQGSAVISQYDYDYDLNGNRTVQIESNGGVSETTTYDFDNNDRLKVVDYPASTVSYTYDANYNRETEQSLDKASGALTVDKTFIYNNRNQLDSISDNLDNTQNVTYQYDSNGNQTIKSKNGLVTTFVYDVRDKLITVRESTTTLGQFFYDYQGMRVAKTGEQGLVRYTYDDDSVLLQTDGSGSTIAKYEYGPDRLLSLDHASEGRQFYHFDALGSTVNLTKADASVQARYQYDAWGNFRSEVGSSFNRFTFTGHEKDTETNLFYFKARYYDPDTGRFLSQDAYLGEAQTPPSLHRYLYAYGNPTVYVDLNGYEACVGHELANCPLEQYTPENRSVPQAISDTAYQDHTYNAGIGGFSTLEQDEDYLSETQSGNIVLPPNKQIYTKNYRLEPYVSGEAPDGGVQYYLAVPDKEHDSKDVLIIPPSRLDDFVSEKTQDAFYNFYHKNGKRYFSESELEGYRWVRDVFRGEYKKGFGHLGNSHKEALSDPYTYLSFIPAGVYARATLSPSRNYIVSQSRIARYEANLQRLQQSGYSNTEKLAEFAGRIEMLKLEYVLKGDGKLVGSRLAPGEGKGRTGIDRVYEKYNDAADNVILESKYRNVFTGNGDPLNLLSQTKAGQQMTTPWINTKIDAMRFGPHGPRVNALGDDLFVNGYNNRYLNVLNQNGDSFIYNLDNLGLK